MNASIIIYFEQISSTISQYPKEVLTECWPWIIVGVGAIAVGGFAAIKIWSRILSVEGRQAAKPIIEE